jgi:hypothetical protein
MCSDWFDTLKISLSETMASLDQICLVVSEKTETGRHGIAEILLKVAL